MQVDDAESRFAGDGVEEPGGFALTPDGRIAQFAHPGRQVVSISGDGGFSMMLSELLTVAMYKLPVKIVM